MAEYWRWLVPSLVSLFYVCILISSAFSVLGDGSEARRLYEDYGIQRNHVCSRYLDRIKTLNYFRYSILVASTVTTVTYVLQCLFGLFSNCSAYSVGAQIGISLIVFVVTLFVSFKIQNCWISRSLCGRNECSERPAGVVPPRANDFA